MTGRELLLHFHPEAAYDCLPPMTPFAMLLGELQTLHDKKNRDYSPGEEYRNMRAAEAWGTPGWVYACQRIEEKMRRLQAFALTGKLENESAEDSLKDVSILAGIALLLLREGRANGD